jgi:hypothetical protein
MGLFKKKEPETVEIKGKQLKCSHCGNQYFWQRHAQLNTAVATFFNFDWANESATCCVCSECTQITWFLGE